MAGGQTSPGVKDGPKSPNMQQGLVLKDSPCHHHSAAAGDRKGKGGLWVSEVMAGCWRVVSHFTDYLSHFTEYFVRQHAPLSPCSCGSLKQQSTVLPESRIDLLHHMQPQ